ncbi:unnamed protein product [Acanthosepion pharaonis]|uniref:Uncharacterized protein n=1 Tax=Acanthosepion pharaonis TaxID=158019 RepID=A0A812DIP2_ACAPH|nr:unnamed protein product [Sepia pharaonis]
MFSFFRFERFFIFPHLSFQYAFLFFKSFNFLLSVHHYSLPFLIFLVSFDFFFHLFSSFFLHLYIHLILSFLLSSFLNHPFRFSHIDFHFSSSLLLFVSHLSFIIVNSSFFIPFFLSLLLSFLLSFVFFLYTLVIVMFHFNLYLYSSSFFLLFFLFFLFLC